MNKGVISVLSGALIALSGCSMPSEVSSSVTLLRLAHNMNEGHPVHQSLAYFAERVREKSGGELVFQLYPNGQLGSEREVIELIQTGAVDVTKVSATALESFSNVYSLFSVPYLFADPEHYYRVMDSDVATDIYQQTSDNGFFGLTYYDSGIRNVYTVDTPVRTPEDMRGLKLRVQPSQTALEMIRLMGGAPTPMAYGEVYTALQQGVIDGTENNETALTSSNHGEVAKEYSYTAHAIVPDLLIFSQHRWQSFTPQQQQWLREAAIESTEFHKELWAQEIEKAVTRAEEMGVNFHHDVDVEAFREAVAPMHERVLENPVLAPLYERIQALETES
ncbi:TRAP transporter substrate-binding protein [Halomonas aquamarina]|uniref:TRAP transporter substrate-binding protein n=1 Tax=Vreelandella aquamarina TaxID=77097 RepID=A0ACC5VQJ1_9GAMM|nr:TRAP transporter substrate-binding protein [Halomonas aquamarina]MBZ5486543.1 TRAP transporter substrate-binding protein [Halomonas aquamarina]